MMGLSNKQETIDKLLRAGRARPGGPPQACREFDADLANAYVERRLTTNEVTHYEQHLSACAPCRKNVVALTRLAAADPASAHTDAKPVAFGEPRTGWLTGRKSWFGALLTPRWAMAAVAVIVFAISLPLLLARKDARMADQYSATDSLAAPSSNQASAADKYQGEGRNASPTAQPNQPSVASIPQAKVEREPARSNGPAPAPAPTTEAPAPDTTLATAAAPKPPVEPKPAPADETATKTTERATGGVAGGAPAARQNETPLPKVDEEKAKRLGDKDSANVTTLKLGRADGSEDKKEATIRPDTDHIAPPPKSSVAPEPHARKSMSAKSAGSAGSALRDSREEAARAKPRLPGKKIAKKQFWLRDNVWTDEDYNPDKEIPVVTIIRDSDVYKEVLIKRAGMKSYLTGFGENESVIFVHKGTVYKLVPQKDNK